MVRNIPVLRFEQSLPTDFSEVLLANGQKLHFPALHGILVPTSLRHPKYCCIIRNNVKRAIMVVIACGAIAKEILELKRLNGWEGLELVCLSASLHNTPRDIPVAVEEKIAKAKAEGKGVFVAYADCGTGGMLDKVLERHGVERLPGAHCYEFFSTSQVFLEMMEQEPATFFLTDFLVKSFDHLVIKGLGLDRYPELLSTYFGNYKRLVYLAQFRDDSLIEKAKQAAQRLGLEFEFRYTGFGDLETSLALQVQP